jgi:hypothetical protein
MQHLECGGTVDTDDAVPFCDKCGWGIKAVEKSNAKAAAKAATKVEKQAAAAVWWNTKRFSTENMALLYRSDKADKAFLEANAAYIRAGQEKYDPKLYEEVRRLYAKAATTAKQDDDVVTYAILDSMQDQIDRSEEQHRDGPEKENTTREPIHWDDTAGDVEGGSASTDPQG